MISAIIVNWPCTTLPAPPHPWPAWKSCVLAWRCDKVPALFGSEHRRILQVPPHPRPRVSSHLIPGRRSPVERSRLAAKDPYFSDPYTLAHRWAIMKNEQAEESKVLARPD